MLVSKTIVKSSNLFPRAAKIEGSFFAILNQRQNVYTVMAQLAQHLPCKQALIGSNPVLGAIFIVA